MRVAKIGLLCSVDKTSSILGRLRDSKQVKQCHAASIASGLSDDVFTANNLIKAYAACGLFKSAESLLYRLVHKNVVSWTILISGFAKVGGFIKSVELFREMLMTGARPNAVTVSSIVPAFGNLGLSLVGKSVHGYWIRVLGFSSNVFVETALVDMYGKLGLVDVARKVFDEMPDRNIVTWNAIISVYSGGGLGVEAMWLFNEMRRIGFGVDCYTVVSIVSACLSGFYTCFGDCIHCLVIRAGLATVSLVKTSLLQFYVSVLKIEEAYMVFNEISAKDMVVWTLMLNGLAEGGYHKNAREHFSEMMCAEDIKLDSVVYMAILSSCRDSGALMQGRRIHALVIKAGFECHVFLVSSLIDMYSNCGQLKDASKIFEGVEEKDVVCWNSMIHGFGMNGFGGDALNLFLEMGCSSVCPNDSTLVQILSACSHAGMVSEGLEIFNHAFNNKKMVPKPEHYACVVDLLARAGKLTEALSFINNMPVKPGSGVYGALFGACRTHEDFRLGIETAKPLLDSDPVDPGFYLLLLNILSQVGNLTDIDKVRTLLKSKTFIKEPGFSSIELNHEVYTFMVGGAKCQTSFDIDNVLKALDVQSK